MCVTSVTAKEAQIMPRNSKVIRISVESLNTLAIIAEKSGMSRKQLIHNWTEQLSSVLTDLGDFHGLTVLSYRPLNKDGTKAEGSFTRLGKITLNSEEELERDYSSDVDAQILANNRASETKDKIKIRFKTVKK
jgi:hypothetical protein